MASMYAIATTLGIGISTSAFYDGPCPGELILDRGWFEFEEGIVFEVSSSGHSKIALNEYLAHAEKLNEFVLLELHNYGILLAKRIAEDSLGNGMPSTSMLSELQKIRRIIKTNQEHKLRAYEAPSQDEFKANVSSEASQASVEQPVRETASASVETNVAQPEYVSRALRLNRRLGSGVGLNASRPNGLPGVSRPPFVPKGVEHGIGEKPHSEMPAQEISSAPNEVIVKASASRSERFGRPPRMR